MANALPALESIEEIPKKVKGQTMKYRLMNWLSVDSEFELDESIWPTLTKDNL